MERRSEPAHRRHPRAQGAERRRCRPHRQQVDPLRRDRRLSRNARPGAGRRRRRSSTRSPPPWRARCPIAPSAGRAATSGAQAGFDIDLGGLLDGNSIRLSYTDNVHQHAAHRHPGAGRRSGRAAAAQIRRPTIRTTRSSASISPAGLPRSSASSSAAFSTTSLQFSNPAGTTLRILDDGGPNRVDVDARLGDQTSPH